MACSGNELQTKFFDHLSKAIAVLAHAGMAESQADVGPGSFDIKAACVYLSVGETTFRQLVKDGDIEKPFQSGGRPHWTRDDLDKYLRRVARKRE